MKSKLFALMLLAGGCMFAQQYPAYGNGGAPGYYSAPDQYQSGYGYYGGAQGYAAPSYGYGYGYVAPNYSTPYYGGGYYYRGDRYRDHEWREHREHERHEWREHEEHEHGGWRR
jgi:hypothetical protein